MKTTDDHAIDKDLIISIYRHENPVGMGLRLEGHRQSHDCAVGCVLAFISILQDMLKNGESIADFVHGILKLELRREVAAQLAAIGVLLVQQVDELEDELEKKRTVEH